MTANLQIKNKTYYAVFRVVDESGKSKQKWVSTKIPADGRHKKEAQKKANEIVESYKSNKEQNVADVQPASKVCGASNDIQFWEWVGEWINQKRLDVDPVTYEGYDCYYRLHIMPYFKDNPVLLSEITSQDIQKYHTSKLSVSKGDGGLSGKSLRNHHVVIHGALEDAVRKGIIASNPADGVKLPKKNKPVGKYYTANQTELLIKAIQGSTIADIVSLTVFYGLRRSEAVGLKWSSVDLYNRTFEICSTVVSMYHTYEKDTTKNDSSNRTYPMTDDTYNMFVRIRGSQIKNKDLFGSCYEDSDYVFTWPDGRLITPSYVSHKFSKLLEQNGLPHIRYHDLRHTTASLLIANGFNLKDIQEWLGHKDIATTANIYGHLDFERKRKTADAMSGIIQT